MVSKTFTLLGLAAAVVARVQFLASHMICETWDDI